MKIRLSAFAVTLAMLVGQQAVNAQPPGYPMPAGYFAEAPGAQPQPNGYAQNGACPDNGCCDPCSQIPPAFCDRWQVWGEFLYLRPRNVEITYGVPTVAVTSPS